MEEKGSKMEVGFSSEEREKGDLEVVSSYEISRIPECKKGTIGKILDRGMMHSKFFKR